jgi:hypothetical protein
MHGKTTIKIIDAQQAKLRNNYKNTRLKLLKTNAAIWYNKMCRIKQLQPKYINIRSKGNRPQDKKTTNNAVRYRLNQEIKYLYCKKQNINNQLYNIQLECMQYCNGLWQLIQSSVDSQINDFMEQTYQKLNKKLDTLTKQTQTAHSNTGKKSHTNEARIINLSKVKFTGEQISTLALGPNYANRKTPTAIPQ